MMLAQAVADYVTLKQALGMRFRTEARILTAFARALGAVELRDVTPRAVQAYLAGAGPLTTFWHRKFEALTGFYRFAVGRGYAARAPLPTTVPKRPAPFVPYLYTPAEVQRLLAATARLAPTPRVMLPAATVRTLLLLLYGTGLRLGEALALTLADVDLPESLLTIRTSKFYKTRLVPVGPELTRLLADYAQVRQGFPRPVGMASAFLALRTGQPLSRGRAEATFRRLRGAAGVQRTDGARYPAAAARFSPRLRGPAPHRVVPRGGGCPAPPAASGHLPGPCGPRGNPALPHPHPRTPHLGEPAFRRLRPGGVP